MFTIMHETMDGVQRVFKAVQVQHIPLTDLTKGSDGVHLLSGPGEGGLGVECGVIRDGKVFVMNDSGATVARFYLDRPQEPPPQ